MFLREALARCDLSPAFKVAMIAYPSRAKCQVKPAVKPPDQIKAGGTASGEAMNCTDCIHQSKVAGEMQSVCAVYDKPIPWEFLFKGCDQWASKRIIHNRDAPLVTCNLCSGKDGKPIRMVLEPRGVMPKHWPDGHHECLGSLTNQYTETGERMKTGIKQSAD